ncbi:PspA/IM30 family protein [Pseudoalteromonas luteoviolacea]|uniref:Phage shock protein A n=1 Tax=Pseudoalteromonas luteoviolacea NCIMB 1942 TaxID=1365253 RepID=A0A167ERR0_9GAMM|nr:PspA/IM30 family protein [Pseudoalteromonas luteoviolacea]KZN51119.1 hypothetical protein N482_00500 [Pseudoalteromonas luteoviolacea NCIMB 1942]KZX00935.1 hypothetical protein JL49_08975 [Pseudoalteromonas luteoviolacea]
MALINRIEDFIKSEFNALLDNSERPINTPQASYRALQEALTSSRELAAKLICEKKMLQRQIHINTDKMQDWYEKAQYAVEKERDDLARAALEEKHKCAHSIERSHTDLDEVCRALENVESDITTLKNKIRSLIGSDEHQSIREDALSARLKIKEILNNPAVQSLYAQFETLERKLTKAESKDEYSADTQRRKTQHAFNELLKSENVELMLQSLKRKISSNSSQKSTAN